VLLADLQPAELNAYLESASLAPITSSTISSRDALVAELDRVREQGWSLTDQEVEYGVRSVAAPIRSVDGRVLASLSLSTQTGSLTMERLQAEVLPLVLGTARQISQRGAFPD
jgi:IclR family pca regulon transcriptional regulator